MREIIEVGTSGLKLKVPKLTEKQEKILKSITLLQEGAVVVLLYKFPGITITESGLMNPLYEITSSDSGKAIPKLSEAEFSSVGKVVKIEKSVTNVLVGDEVFIPRHLVSPNIEFIIDRASKTAGGLGLIKISSDKIEGIIKTV